jgi:hypothetical protein
MKRIKAACIVQTLRFAQKDEMFKDQAKQFNAAEVERYKKSLERSRTKYKILSETEEADGSIVMEIKKQYNMSPVGEYLN